MHLRSFVFCIALFATPVAFSQSARTGGSNNTQLLQQLQQLASERTQLQAENAKLERELAEARKERDAFKSSQERLSEHARASDVSLARAAREREVTESELANLKERTQDLIAKFRETAQALREVETDRATAKQSLAQRVRDLTACVNNNQALYQLNDEILDRLENQGLFTRMARAEPFTKLKRVQLENLVEDYRYRAEEQKLSTAPAAATP